MNIIKKIKRLSAEYRKHEKEIKELEVKQAIETMKTIVATVTSAVQLAAIAAQPKKKKNITEGGIVVGENRIAGDNKEECTISLNKEALDKIIADLKNKKVN